MKTELAVNGKEINGAVSSFVDDLARTTLARTHAYQEVEGRKEASGQGRWLLPLLCWPVNDPCQLHRLIYKSFAMLSSAHHTLPWAGFSPMLWLP